jgi:hypothetical protein
MKKSTLPTIFLFAIILFNTRVVKAESLYDACPRSEKFYQTGTLREIDPTSGVTVSVNTYVGAEGNKKNVVVFGQDPEEEGVGVTVTLTPVTGDIVHNEQVTSCKYYGLYPDNTRKGLECNSPGDSGYYYKETECLPVRTPGASRKVNDVRVWLEPSQATEDWLGWKQGEKGGKATLRFMFPEKWMAGTWTEDGFTVTETPDLSWYSSYYEEWLQQVAGYNFLAGDTATIDNLWSVTMVEVANPNPGGSQSLGIYGYFDLSNKTYPRPRDLIGGDQWRVNYGEFNTYTKLHRATCEPDPLNSVPLGTNIIRMEHIPLDLPGKWSIGIQVEMSKASVWYQYSSAAVWEITEEWQYEDETQWFIQPGEFNYNDIKSFYSFVLLTTPCNPLEEDNCIDDTW